MSGPKVPKAEPLPEPGASPAEQEAKAATAREQVALNQRRGRDATILGGRTMSAAAGGTPRASVLGARAPLGSAV